MKRIVSILILFLAFTQGITAGIVGEWTVYSAFGEIKSVEKAGKIIYVLSGTTLYSINTNDESVTVYDKTNSLSDTEISFIKWCEDVKKLVIVYSNQNIDLLQANGDVVNISDFYSKPMIEDKTVNGIDIYAEEAFLSTNFGIVRLNVAKAEIVNAYILEIPVNWTHLENGRIYAESKEKGQFSASLSDNLLDNANWTKTGGYTAPETVSDPELIELAGKYKPNGPVDNHFGVMKVSNGRLYTASGMESYPERYAYIQIKNSDNEWTIIDESDKYNTPPRYRNIFDIDINPADGNHWVIGGQAGLYEYKNGQLESHKYWENSILESATTVSATSKNYTEVTTVKFDKEGNVWMLQGIARTPGIIKQDKDGVLTRFEHSELRATEDFAWVRPSGLGFDSNGLLWFVNNDWRVPALASYDTENDKLHTYTKFVNQDNTELNLAQVRCWAEDKENNIWIGTTIGPAYLLADDIAAGAEVFQQAKIPREDDPGLADYLLSGVDVSCIAIDAGNRKWFGTNGQGVYLISSDNMTQIHHFTQLESGLLSNNIEAIAIDHTTGEVYFATDKGLCSYISDASEVAEELDSDNVYAYPNPVEPDYTGLITINGLTYNANVKIVTSSGHLVAKGVSSGGTFTWNGCDLQGKRVASGVYMVLTATEDGKEGAVCKIAVVR